MSDWLRLSEQDEALLRSCDRNESIVLIDGAWQKMSRSMIEHVLVDAYLRGARDACASLGISPPRHEASDDPKSAGVININADLARVDFDHDIENGTVTAMLML